MNVNSINCLSINGIAIDDNMGFDGILGVQRNPLNLLWANLLAETQSVVPVIRGIIPKPHPEAINPDRFRWSKEDEEITEAVNTKQIGMVVVFDNKQYAQAIDRADHGITFSVPHFKVDPGLPISEDIKIVMEYVVKDFRIETTREDDNETIEKQTIKNPFHIGVSGKG